MRQGIRVSMLSDARLLREMIALRLLSEDGIDLVGAASTVGELAAILPAAIDVVLVHLDVEPDQTVGIVGQVRETLPASRVVVIGWGTDDSDAVRRIEAGASACLPEDASYEALVETIRSAHAGRMSCSARTLAAAMRRIGELVDSHETANEFAEDCESEPLSLRETQVARLIALGNKQIAKELGIRPKTVKHHVGSILRKLRVRRRRDVIGRV